MHKMAQPDQLLKLPDLISTLGSSVTTNFPANQVADYVANAQNVPSENIKQVVLGPPTYTVTGISAVTASTCLINAKVAALSVQWLARTASGTANPRPETPARSRQPRRAQVAAAGLKTGRCPVWDTQSNL